MGRQFLTAGVLASVALMATGCDTIMDRRYSIFNQRAQTMGANQLIKWQTFEPIYLPALLAPEQYKNGPGTKDYEVIGAEIDQAFARFRADHGTNSQRYALARNSVQDRIIGSSVQRCNFFKLYLRRVDQSLNLSLGSLATVAGGVGAIVTGVGAARALAGTAGIFSGLRAEVNEDLFAGLALQVLTDGIDAKRQRIREAIEEKRSESTSTPSSYTVEAAVADALLYHGACSLVDGLKEANAAIIRSRNPGLEEFRRVNRALLGDQALRDATGVQVQASVARMLVEAKAVQTEVQNQATALMEELNEQAQKDRLTQALSAFNAAVEPITKDGGSLEGKLTEAIAKGAEIAGAAADLAEKQAASEPSVAEQQLLQAKQAEGLAVIAQAQELLDAVQGAADEIRVTMTALRAQIAAPAANPDG